MSNDIIKIGSRGIIELIYKLTNYIQRMFQSAWNFISYWYFRYLLVTELYMVEKWERVFIHVFFVAVFGALSYFNSRVILSFVEYFIRTLCANMNMAHISTGHTIMENSAHPSLMGEL